MPKILPFLVIATSAWSCVSSKIPSEPRKILTPEDYGPVSFAHCFAEGGFLHMVGGYRVKEDMSMFNSSGISYALAERSWKVWPAQNGPAPKNNFSAAEGTRGIYVFGGSEQGKPETRDFYLFDPISGQWEAAPQTDRLKPRSSSSLTATGEWLTLFGGRTAMQKSNWGVYSERSRSWKVYANYTAERTSHVAVSLGNRVLIWGGFEDQKRTQGGLILDPSNGDVKPLANMPFLEPRANAKAVSEKEKVWIIGGVGEKGAKTDGAFYDEAYQSWQYIPPLPEPDRKDFQITLIPDVGILLWGGRTTEGKPVTKSYVLDLMRRTWREVSMPVQPDARIAHCLGTTDVEIYIFGGLTHVPGKGQSLSRELWLMPQDSISIKE